MATYTRPGVFVNQTQAPNVTSAGAAPGAPVACFAANYNVGPTVPKFITSWQQYVQLFGGFTSGSPSYLPFAVYQYFTNGGTGCFVFRVPNSDAVQATVSIFPVAGTGSPVLTITAKNPGVYGNSTYFTITPTTGTATSTFNLQIYQGGTTSASLVESWNGISLNPQSQRYAASVVNSTTSGSAYVTLSGFPTAYVSGTTDPKTVTTPTALNAASGGAGNPIEASTSGSDGTTAIDLNWAITGSTAFGGTAPGALAWNQGHLTNFANQVINLNMPDTSLTGSIQYSLINNIASWAQSVGNVFLVIDGQFQGGSASSATVAASYVTMTNSGNVAASSVAAIYGPWLSIQDPISTASGATRWLPPGGAVLGYWETNDLNYGIGQVPAGNPASLNALALEAYFTPTDLGSLETAQINPIKVVPQSGFCIYGALTTQAQYPARYINNSRVVLKITNDLTAITSFAVFQNNGPTLWQNLTNVITNYLTEQMQSHVLAGSTQAESFQVICDNTINTPTTIQAGVVNVQVAVAIASPAEFVVISISQQQSGATATISS